MRFFLKLGNKIRRGIMSSIDKSYISKKLKLRSGKCLKCGQCCMGCKCLDSETKKCKVYDNRPSFCHRDFPIDELDKKVFGVKNCGYRFKN
jgi:hypothetical protein